MNQFQLVFNSIFNQDIMVLVGMFSLFYYGSFPYDDYRANNNGFLFIIKFFFFLFLIVTLFDVYDTVNSSNFTKSNRNYRETYSLLFLFVRILGIIIHNLIYYLYPDTRYDGRTRKLFVFLKDILFFPFKIFSFKRERKVVYRDKESSNDVTRVIVKSVDGKVLMDKTMNELDEPIDFSDIPNRKG